jgi:hypothetical protein
MADLCQQPQRRSARARRPLHCWIRTERHDAVQLKCGPASTGCNAPQGWGFDGPDKANASQASITMHTPTALSVIDKGTFGDLRLVRIAASYVPREG